MAFGSAVLVGVSTGSWNELPVLFALIISGACAGFLPHNFPNARMFMGDVSSAPLGFLLAFLCLWLSVEYGWWLMIPLVLLHANFVLDTGITLLRRIINGEKWYAPHREHFYQRLIRSGKSHTFVTLMEMDLQVTVLLLMVLYLNVTPPIRIALILSVFTIWATFFMYCETQFRKSKVDIKAD